MHPSPHLAICYRPVASLIPFAKNARTHSDAQVAQIAASMREFGWTNPILVDEEAGIIAGHGRLMAARKLGMDTVPVIELAGLSEAQKRALVIADNKLALNAGWDDELLGLELADLGELGFNLALTGFDDLEIARLTNLGNAGLTDPDDIPEVPDVATSLPGDLWLLGDHRLVCGDSTNAADVARVLGSVRPHLMVSDPPYGVNYDPAWRAGLANGPGLATGKVLNDNRADWREAWTLFPGDVAYVWCASLHSHEVAASLIASGFDLRSQIVWDKTRLVIGRGDYHWQHEPAWYAVRKGKTGHWAGDRKQTTVWAIPHRKSPTGHGTEKPVECMRRPIKNNSSAGQAVYEPFCGSGTTIIACEMMGRSCHAIELDPAYVDLAILRWQEFTGLSATLEGDGRSFSEVAASRKPRPSPPYRRPPMLVEPLPQSRVASLVEASTNVAAGFFLAIGIQRGIYPLFGIETDLMQDGAIALIFTAVSLVRSYTLRRLFLFIEAYGRREFERSRMRLDQRLASGRLPAGPARSRYR